MIKEIKIKFNGVELFYRQLMAKKSAKNIIMLHGYSFTSREWEQIGAMDYLANLGYNVYAIDYPGFGKSDKNPNFEVERGNILNSSSFILAFMDFMGMHSASLIGASMGGGIAILSAIETDMRIESMILIGPAWFPDDALSLITINTLFIFGENDDLISQDDLLPKISEKSNFSVKIMRDAGHAAYMDKPDAFLQVTKEFLASQ